MDLQTLVTNTLSTIKTPASDDPILKCFNYDIEAHRKQLVNDPVKALELANSKLYVFPFKDVDNCWRRLYTDASILIACSSICENLLKCDTEDPENKKPGMLIEHSR